MNILGSGAALVTRGGAGSRRTLQFTGFDKSTVATLFHVSLLTGPKRYRTETLPDEPE